MVLDVCPPLPSPPAVVELAVERTGGVGGPRPRRPPPRRPGAVRHRPGRHRRGAADARAPSRTAALDFDGYGIGGLSVGETRAEMLPALAAALAAAARRPAALPDGRRRPGLAGRGGRPRRRPVRLRDADPPRPPRHRPDRRPASCTSRPPATATRTSRSTPRCACAVCARHSRGYLRHLFAVGEPTASRLVSYHNVAWTLDLMARLRAAIVDGTFDAVRAGRPRGLGLMPGRRRPGAG